MSEVLIDIGRRLKSERERLCIRQDEVAKMIGAATVSISRYENGRAIPVDALQILNGHGFDVGYIITGEHDGQRITHEESELLSFWRKCADNKKDDLKKMIELFVK